MGRRAAAPVANTDVEMIDIAMLAVSSINVRSTEQNAIKDILVDSIAHDGIRQPLIVRPVGKTFEIIDGSQRYHAAVQLGMKKVPCVVDADANALTSLTMNLSSRAMTDADVLVAFRHMVNDNVDINAALKVLRSLETNKAFVNAMTALDERWVAYAQQPNSNLNCASALRKLAKLPSHAQASIYDQAMAEDWPIYRIENAAQNYFKGDLNDQEKESIEGHYKALGGRVELPLFKDAFEETGKFVDTDLIDKAFDRGIDVEVKRLNDNGFTNIRVLDGRRQTSWDIRRKERLSVFTTQPTPEQLDAAARTHNVMDFPTWLARFSAAQEAYEHGEEITDPEGMTPEEQADWYDDANIRWDLISDAAHLMAAPKDATFIVYAGYNGIEVDGPLVKQQIDPQDAEIEVTPEDNDDDSPALSVAAGGRLRNIHANMMSYLLCQDPTASFRFIAWEFYQQATTLRHEGCIGMKTDYTGSIDDGYAKPREQWTMPRFEHTHPSICREWFMTSPIELLTEAFVWSVSQLLPKQIPTSYLKSFAETPSKLILPMMEPAYCRTAGVEEREAWFKQFPLATLRAYANKLDPSIGKMLAGTKKGEAAASLAKLTAGLSQSLGADVQEKVRWALPPCIDIRSTPSADADDA